METKANATYIQPKGLSERYGICINTVKSRIREIEQEVQKGRYSQLSIINDDRIVLVNELVFLDYLKNRQLLKDKTARRNVKPFNPTEWVKMLGYMSIPKVMD